MANNDYNIYIYMEVSINSCGNLKWMAYDGKSHLEMDDDWGYPYFRKPPNGLFACETIENVQHVGV